MHSETPITPQQAAVLEAQFLGSIAAAPDDLSAHANPPAAGPRIAPQALRRLRLSDRYRNQPCACGSGKKFKRCCGKP